MSIQDVIRPWADQYKTIHAVAHWDDSERKRSGDYDSAFEQAASDAEQLLKQSRAARDLAERCRREGSVRTMRVAASDARFFLNCNTPADLAAVQRRL